MVHLTSVFL